MEFQKVNNVWTRRTEQLEKIPIVEEHRNATEEVPRVPSPEPSQAPQSDMPSSSSSTTITEEKLMSIVNSMTEDLKEYIYES